MNIFKYDGKVDTAVIRVEFPSRVAFRAALLSYFKGH